MWISIRTRRMSLGTQLRRKIEKHVARVFERQRRNIASVVLYLSPAELTDTGLKFSCRIVLWSPVLGQVAITRLAPSVRQAVRQATQQARQGVRRRLARRQALRRRRNGNRLYGVFTSFETPRDGTLT
jgi:hypothetical protein